METRLIRLLKHSTDWTKAYPLRFFVVGTLIYFSVFAGLRLVFLFLFSGLGSAIHPGNSDLLKTLQVGFAFDLRLALLVMIPIGLLTLLPGHFNTLVRRFSTLYFYLVTGALLLIYIIDFGHYDYLGTRINTTVFRFLEDSAISTVMLWQSYPVIWITIGWLVSLFLIVQLILRCQVYLCRQPPYPISKVSILFGSCVVFCLVFLGLLGRVSNINFKNPVPVRWSDAFFSGSEKMGAVGLNPVIHLYDTRGLEKPPYQRGKVEFYYHLIADYLGVDADKQTPLQFNRDYAGTAHNQVGNRTPNLVIVMLESLGASRLGVYGNPLNPTPELDKIAATGWMFEHFYVPVPGTAKSVWASITGVPDVSLENTASRNPLITRQQSVFNAFDHYQKLYLVGGNSGWANINAVIRKSINGVTLYDESNLEARNIDVWGMSDLDLFRATDRILRQIPGDRPFFAYVQTAGNHRPFTIPEDNDGFVEESISESELRRYGFKNARQFNAVRLLDFNVGRFMALARAGGYFDNTIFAFYGDHNNRITTLGHMPPAFEKLGIESNHVPCFIYAPAYLQQQTITEAVSLVDLAPTLASLMGISFSTGTLGRPVQEQAPEGERAVPIVLREGAYPIIGAITSEFLVQMNRDGSNATLHLLDSPTPEQDLSKAYPDEFNRLSELTHGLYETAHFMLYNNRVDPQRE